MGVRARMCVVYIHFAWTLVFIKLQYRVTKIEVAYFFPKAFKAYIEVYGAESLLLYIFI